MITISGHSQNLAEESRTEVTLSDGNMVVLYRAHAGDGEKTYCYLPVNMRLSSRDGRPEISLLKFSETGNEGAVLHFLLTWGLSDSNRKEANELLNLKLRDSVFVSGPAMVDAAPESFLITGNDRLVGIMNKALRQHSQVPLYPGSKMAASFRFEGADAEYLEEIIGDHNKTVGGEIRMIFVYNTMVREGYLSKPVAHEWVLSIGLDTLINTLRN